MYFQIQKIKMMKNDLKIHNLNIQKKTLHKGMCSIIFVSIQIHNTNVSTNNMSAFLTSRDLPKICRKCAALLADMSYKYLVTHSSTPGSS